MSLRLFAEYGVETAQLKRAVRRNIERFPSDFMFEFTREEHENLRCQIGISSWGVTKEIDRNYINCPRNSGSKEVNMPSRAVVIQEVETVPEPLLGEVLDFIAFVKARSIREGLYTAIASESSLKKDWLCAEEDEAWDSL